MSTYWYFACLDHDPALGSGDEFTQHTDDAAYRNALALAAQRPLDPAWWDGDQGGDGGYMERNARRFLGEHPKCRIAAVSEYGDRVQLSGNQAPAQADDGDRLIEFAEQILGVPLDPWQVRLCRRVFGGNVGHSTGRPDAVPPRIADMVPGTTLDEALRWTVRRDRHGNTFLRRHDRSGAYVECWPRDIDPSTIRDVTPPAVTP